MHSWICTIPLVSIDIIYKLFFTDYHPTTRNAKKYYKKRKAEDVVKPVKPSKKPKGDEDTEDAKPKAKGAAKSAAKKKMIDIYGILLSIYCWTLYGQDIQCGL